MIKSFLNNSLGSRMGALAVTGALALSASSALAATTFTPFTFDTDVNNWWINGWGGQAAGTVWSGAQDHTGNGGGSLNLVDDFSGGSQSVQVGWFGGAWGSSPMYDLTQYTNIDFWVKLDTTASTIPLSQFRSTGETLQLWAIQNGNNWIDLGSVVVPNTASNGWVQINWPVDITIPGIDQTVGLGFKKWTGGGNVGVTSMYIDDIEMQAGGGLPPVTLSPPYPATPGLNLTAMTGPYTREEIVQTNGDESFLVGNPHYSFTVTQGADGTGGVQFQNHIFLVPSATTESGPDWTQPNVIFMDLESTTTGGTVWTFRYKTNLPNGNNMCYNNGGLTVTVTNAGSGYTSAPLVGFTGGSGPNPTIVGAIAQIDAGAGTVTNVVLTNSWGFTTAPTAVVFTGGGGSGAGASVALSGGGGIGGLATLTETNIRTGTWTLSVSGGNTFTMTSPSGLTTNVVLDPTIAALFPAPVHAYFGVQCGNTAGVGAQCVLSNVTITGTATPVNDTFKNDSTLNTNIWQAYGDGYAVQLIPGATPYIWVKWSVPATGYSLQGGTTLNNFVDSTPIFQGQFGTKFGALVPRLSDTRFYRTIKRVPTQLQVLMPGQVNAPNTVSGYTGTATPISVAGQGLTTTTVTVNLCDATWHIVNGSDSIMLSTSDGNAYLPTTNPINLVNGTATFSDPNGILFQTPNAATTVTAHDNTTVYPDAISAPFTVNP